MPGLRFIGYVMVACTAVFALVASVWFFFSRGGFGMLNCPRCASLKVRHSVMPQAIDRPFRWVGVDAFRCEGCGLRFHAFRWYRRAYTRH